MDASNKTLQILSDFQLQEYRNPCHDCDEARLMCCFAAIAGHLTLLSSPILMAEALSASAGGYEYDGKTEITPVNEGEVHEAVQDAILQGITSFVICGVFSPIRSSQELQVKQIVQSMCHTGRPGSCTFAQQNKSLRFCCTSVAYAALCMHCTYLADSLEHSPPHGKCSGGGGREF